MNILVIGGNGFVGSHLVDLLLMKGHKVRVFDASNEYYRKPLSKVEYFISTLDNTPNLVEALSDIDCVFYAASSSGSNIISDINELLIPTISLLDLMVKLGIKRLIYFSSGSALYSNSKGIPVNEGQALNPLSSYGIIKATIEKYILLYQNKYDMKPLIIRSANKYGPRQGNSISKGVILTFLKKIKSNEPLMVFGDGNSFKDYIYIADLIDLSYELSFSNEVGIFNLGSGVGTSINQILRQLKVQTHHDFIINYCPKQINNVDHLVLDISKVSQYLGAHSFISLEDGINKTWMWLNSIEYHECNK